MDTDGRKGTKSHTVELDNNLRRGLSHADKREAEIPPAGKTCSVR